ncbi:hypothetical protein HZB02_07535 [Candidatus Woesearchaeota archaeon]|nr:hypothetical protein [Candidatus Woesearchaeota archaeon]
MVIENPKWKNTSDKLEIQNIFRPKPENEEQDAKITKVSSPKATQYKVAFPKKFAEDINLNEKDFKVKFVLEKGYSEYAITKLYAYVVKK